MYSISVHIHVQYSVWALYTPVPNNKTKIKLVEENQLSCNTELENFAG